MGGNRSGNGLQIRVSKGAIKKLQKQRSTQHSLYSLTRFLLTRYQEARISVEKREDWLSYSFEEYSVDNATVREIDEVINVPNIGPVVVTRHALGTVRGTGFQTVYQSILGRLCAQSCYVLGAN